MVVPVADGDNSCVVVLGWVMTVYPERELPPVLSGAPHESAALEPEPMSVALRFCGGSNSDPTVALVSATNPVESSAITVRLRPLGVVAVKTPFDEILSPATPSATVQLIGSLAPSLRVALKAICPPTPTKGSAGVTLNVAGGGD